jgi:hypothetical protein
VAITASNREQALAQLQKALVQNEISPANLEFADRQDAEAEREREREEAKNDSGLGLYVQSSPEQVSLALRQLRSVNPSSQIRPQRTLALSNIPVLGKDNGRAEPNDRRSLAQLVQEQENAPIREGLGRAGGISKKDLSAPDQNRPRTAASRAAQSATPGTAASGLGGLSVRGQIPATGEGTGIRSFQMLVQTPAGDWSKPNLDEAEGPAPEAKPAESQTESASRAKAVEADAVRKEATPRPIRVMFLFRESPKAETKATEN